MNGRCERSTEASILHPLDVQYYMLDIGAPTIDKSSSFKCVKGAVADMTKRPTKSTAISKRPEASLPAGLISVDPITYPVASTSITALQLYHNPDRKPEGDGPWSNEADKVAWIDSETGMSCIMLRQKDGTISGYVGVDPKHPLFGFEADAVPLDIANVPHGGVTYSKPCEVNRFERVLSGKQREERYTICHVTMVRVIKEYETVQTTQNEFHEDIWWLGFDTNHPGDLTPNRISQQHRGDIYRDQAFVYENCIALARKLKAVGDDAADHTGTGSSQRLLPPPRNSDGVN